MWMLAGLQLHAGLQFHTPPQLRYQSHGMLRGEWLWKAACFCPASLSRSRAMGQTLFHAITFEPRTAVTHTLRPGQWVEVQVLPLNGLFRGQKASASANPLWLFQFSGFLWFLISLGIFDFFFSLKIQLLVSCYSISACALSSSLLPPRVRWVQWLEMEPQMPALLTEAVRSGGMDPAVAQLS